MTAHDSTTIEINREERDGVPVLWADLPGPRTAALLFRSGRSDEPFGLLGINHLIEHLSLFSLGRPPYKYNGFVDLTRTGFTISGTEAEEADFFQSVCTALHALPVDRLAHERRVLLTETANDDGGFFGRILARRYGVTGLGARATHDFALGWVDDEALHAWAARWFTRANAVLWMTGPPSADLALPLPDGERRPVGEFEPVPWLDGPTHLEEGTGGVGLGMLGPRSVALTSGLRLAGDRAVARLRMDEGVTYAVGGDYLAVDAGTAHVILAADCLDEHATAVRDGLVAVLEELAAGEATEDELALDRRRMREAMEHPDWHATRLDREAFDGLCGWPVTPPGELAAEHEALTAQAIGDAMQELLRTRLVLAPAGVAPLDGDAPYESGSPPEVEGRAFRRRRSGVGGRASQRLVVGDDGATLVEDDGHVTVLWTDLAGVVREAPGQLLLVAADGAFLRLVIETWEDGEELEPLLVDRAPEPGVVPGRLLARHEQIRSLASEQLPQPEAVVDLRDQVPALLVDGEEPRALAQARRGRGAGLLVLTDRRILFVAPEGEEHWQALLPEITGASDSSGFAGMGKTRLRIATSEGEEEFKDVAPSERVDDFLEAAGVSSGSG
ncbi:MAG TPA: hypothetical protein VD836_18810 [Solirubrobacteraceae bacterium]|nr:hypothetical protein [Solirubrobacteraceae bacterium]